MQRFEITVNGTAQPNDFATQQEADAAAQKLIASDGSKKVEVRPKADDAAQAQSQTSPNGGQVAGQSAGTSDASGTRKSNAPPAGGGTHR